MNEKDYLLIGDKKQASENLLSSYKSFDSDQSDSERIKALDQAYLEWNNINFYVPKSQQ